MENKYLTKIAAWDIPGFFDAVTGSEHRSISARRDALEHAIANKETPAILRGLEESARKRKINARAGTGAALVGLGLGAYAGGKAYAKSREDKVYAMQAELMSKQAGFGESVINTVKGVAGTAWTGAKHIGAGATELSNKAFGGGVRTAAERLKFSGKAVDQTRFSNIMGAMKAGDKETAMGHIKDHLNKTRKWTVKGDTPGFIDNEAERVHSILQGKIKERSAARWKATAIVGGGGLLYAKGKKDQRREYGVE